MQLRSVGAYHVGEIPRGAVALPDTVLVQSVETDAEMVVGLFKDESDNDYFMIVNDYHRAVTARVRLDRSTDALLTLHVESQRVLPVDIQEVVGGVEFEAEFRPGAGRVYFFTALTTDVEGSNQPSAPSRFALHQNYPNPFNPITTIAYDLMEPGPVRLVVYDALGQVTAVLVDEPQEAGSHIARWSADSAGSGVYVYVLESSGQTLQRKMALLR